MSAAAQHSHKAFFKQLKKYYTFYTGGFLVFLFCLAIAEQMGLSRKWIGYVFLFATVGWLGKLFGWNDAAATVTELAAACPDSEGVYLVPAFVGLGAPWWNPRARGMIHGLTLGSGAELLARAALESIAYQIYDIFAAVQEEAGIPLTTLHADGGASANAPNE